jgi:BirA family biotin operon repressor/biotin-[acetyl-CoA-carboxylase] ligase
MLGRKIIQIECVDSTNNYVANLLVEGKIEHGTVILADEQTNGRGQRGATWDSKAGENLIFSMFIDTAILSVKDQFLLTQIISVAVANLISKFGLKADVKWPNDIYIKGKKIGGILIENQIKGANLNGSIVGIGLNINQIDFYNLNATSLKLEKGEFVPIQSVVFSLINELNNGWEMIVNNQIEAINELYLNKLWLLNVEAMYIDQSGEFIGTIKGVNQNGLLIMLKENELIQYDLKEISFKI